MRDDDLNRRLEQLRADLPTEPLPGATVARERAEHIRRTRRAGGTALAVLGVVSAVVLTAAGGGAGLGTRTPGGASSSPSGDPTFSAAREGVLARGMLQLDMRSLPARLAPWTPVVAVHAAHGAVGCLASAQQASSLEDVALGYVVQPLLSVHGAAVTAAAGAASWASTSSDSGQIERAVVERLTACATVVLTTATAGHLTTITWRSEGSASTVVLVSDGPWLGVVAVETSPGVGGLTAGERAAIAVGIRAHMGPSSATLPKGAAAPYVWNRLYAALIPSTLVPHGSGADSLAFSRTPACLPGLEDPMHMTDVREDPSTVGDVRAEDGTTARWSDGSGWVLQHATQLLTPAAAARLSTRWEGYVSDCPRSKQHPEGTARVTGRRLIPGGVALDLVVTPFDVDPATGSPSPAPGPTGPRVRTVYLGRVGSVVTWICVEGAENHPELGPRLLTRALDRLSSVS